MPFGLYGAAVTFQRYGWITNSLQRSAMAYIGNTVIFSNTWQDDVKDTRNVLIELWRARLTANPSLCNFRNVKPHLMKKGVVSSIPKVLPSVFRDLSGMNPYKMSQPPNTDLGVPMQMTRSYVHCCHKNIVLGAFHSQTECFRNCQLKL